MMHQVCFRFYGELNDFLPLAKRNQAFSHRLKEPAAIKDVIEGLGVPHPEVDLILVNGLSVDFSYPVHDGDRVSVYPLFQTLDVTALSRVRPQPLPEIRFVLDVHLGKLAMYLRLLGFDTLYENDYADETLVEIVSRDRRILLTQDRGLLKRSSVTYGYCIRSRAPEQQVTEVLQRFHLFQDTCPLQRCLRCNGLLVPVSKEEVCDRLPPLTRKYFDEFCQCLVCDRVYWKGSHYDHLQKLIQSVSRNPEQLPQGEAQR